MGTPYQDQSAAGLRDRSSRPHVLMSSIGPTEGSVVDRVDAFRRERWTGYRIAQATGLSRATVSRILRRLGLNRIRFLDSAPVVQRYEHAAPGDLLHLDIKKLGCFARPGHRVTGNPVDQCMAADGPIAM